MCGIVGYIGDKKAYPILMNGLHLLEYRGYDSAGVTLMGKEGDMRVYKSKGKVSELESKVEGKDLEGFTGIGHTRWATHGIPSERNAHPHLSRSGNLSIVHNGIIENYAPIREQLIGEGYTFYSDTDTEVLVQFIEHFEESRGCSLSEAVRLALREVRGAYAILVVDRRNPGEIVAARQGSPMAIGISKEGGEYFIASDATPIVGHTKTILYLEDGEIAVLRRNEAILLTDLDGNRLPVKPVEVKFDLDKLDKGGFDHYMLKEIFEQPSCLRDCMRGRLFPEEGRVRLEAVEQHAERLTSARRFIIVACGTSWHAGLVGKQLIESLCRVPVSVEYASEFRYEDPIIYPTDVVIAISQSGETADTLAAIRLAKEKGAFVLGIVNAVGSSIARLTDAVAYIQVGPEIGVASTKAFTGQLTLIAMLALDLAARKGTIAGEEYARAVSELARIPGKIEETLKLNDQIRKESSLFTYARNFLYLGRGWDFPVALEGALKLKEISYIHAEGYPAAEMKHGPIALVDTDLPVLFIATDREMMHKTLSNMQEVKARGGHILAILPEGSESEADRMAENIVTVPATLPCFSPLLSVIPLQLIAYHVATHKGLNVDRPRNLAKSVTVE